MTLKRREQILSSLRAGNLIYRSWSGGNNGYLRHELQGIKRLREEEVNSLRGELELILGRGRFGSFALRKEEKKEQ